MSQVYFANIQGVSPSASTIFIRLRYLECFTLHIRVSETTISFIMHDINTCTHSTAGPSYCLYSKSQPRPKGNEYVKGCPSLPTRSVLLSISAFRENPQHHRSFNTTSGILQLTLPFSEEYSPENLAFIGSKFFVYAGVPDLPRRLPWLLGIMPHGLKRNRSSVD